MEDFAGGKVNLLIDGNENSLATIILAHGAGAPMDSDWMNMLTTYLVKEGLKVVRFEFPYMAERRLNGKKRPPNKKQVLIDTWLEVVNAFKDDAKLYIGGKSMGGRIATLLTDVPIDGIICFGFPFHAPGKELGERVDDFRSCSFPVLVLQGERDKMGFKEEIEVLNLGNNKQIVWFEDGDHSLKPRKKSGFTLEEHLRLSAKKVLEFIEN